MFVSFFKVSWVLVPSVTYIRVLNSLEEAFHELCSGPVTASLVVYDELWDIGEGRYCGSTTTFLTLQVYYAVNIAAIIQINE